jgi:signal transduction histidine kinase/ActR/RegA family two-component response regulator
MDLGEQQILRLRRRERIRELRELIIISSSWLSIPLFAVFSIADYFYAPDKFVLFACLRMVIFPSCLLVNAAVKRTRSLPKLQAWGAFYVFINAILITIMAFLAGGKTSAYYAGLNLCAVSAGSFIPWTSGALICNLALIYVPFFALSFWAWSKQGNSIFIANSFFMAATVVITLVIRHFNEKYRMSAIRSRVALDHELKRRANIIKEKSEEAISLAEQFRQAQKMEAVGQLAGGVAHDFNNLLMIIRSYADMMAEQLDPEDKHRKNIDQVLKAADRAAALTRQLLAFSRRQVLSPRIIDLNSVVEDSVQMVTRLIGENIELSVSLGKPLWAVKADPGQIVQVLMNLCVNARDAMPNGGELAIRTENVSIDVEAARKRLGLVPGKYASLVVSDTGTGMTKEVQARLFEPFFTTKESGRGTGLGLSTVYGIVKQSGGYIWFDSELGRGSSFTLHLPPVDAPLTTTITPVIKEAEGQGEIILLVEDEEGLRESISTFLDLHGYKVLEASDGAQALHVASQHASSIQVLITDIILPKLSGVELAREVARTSPQSVTLYMSGYSDRELKDYDPTTSTAEFLQKPFALQTLLQKLREMIAKRE